MRLRQFWPVRSAGGAGDCKRVVLLGPKGVWGFCFNRDTHEETLIADFWIPYKDASRDMYYSSAIGATVNRWSFSKDYTRLSDQKIFAANNERHAGWQNVDGSFADVTENLGQQSKSDFEDPVYYRGLGFAGENFGFAYLSNGSLLKEKELYLPTGNLSPDAVQEGDVHKVGLPYNEKGALLISKYGNGKYFPRDVTSWVDATHAIVNLQEEGNYSSFIVDTAAQTEIAYIPGHFRDNWNGVLSPDGTQIAFMSEPKSGTDIQTDIHIVPAGGGNPAKVEGHPHALQGKDYLTKDGTCTLIDWL